MIGARPHRSTATASRVGGTSRRLRTCAALLPLLAALPPLPAAAGATRWAGTLEADFAAYPALKLASSGVASLTGTSGGSHLTTLRIEAGFQGSGTIPITDPDATALYRSIRFTAAPGTGSLGPFWPIEPWPAPQLERNALPVRGLLRVCLLGPDCSNGIVLPLSASAGARGVGVGGLVTAGGFGDLRVSIEAAPWTVYSASLPLATTRGGSTVWWRTGWIHGPASLSSSAAAPGGALQLVTPIVLRSNGGLYLPGFTSLTIEFLPEPGGLVLIAAGVIGLAALHRAAHGRSGHGERRPR